jgi:hypothetical protein
MQPPPLWERTITFWGRRPQKRGQRALFWAHRPPKGMEPPPFWGRRKTFGALRAQKRAQQKTFWDRRALFGDRRAQKREGTIPRRGSKELSCLKVSAAVASASSDRGPGPRFLPRITEIGASRSLRGRHRSAKAVETSQSVSARCSQAPTVGTSPSPRPPTPATRANRRDAPRKDGIARQGMPFEETSRRRRPASIVLKRTGTSLRPSPRLVRIARAQAPKVSIRGLPNLASWISLMCPGG